MIVPCHANYKEQRKVSYRERKEWIRHSDPEMYVLEAPHKCAWAFFWCSVTSLPWVSWGTFPYIYYNTLSRFFFLKVLVVWEAAPCYLRGSMHTSDMTNPSYHRNSWNWILHPELSNGSQIHPHLNHWNLYCLTWQKWLYRCDWVK